MTEQRGFLIQVQVHLMQVHLITPLGKKHHRLARGDRADPFCLFADDVTQGLSVRLATSHPRSSRQQAARCSQV
jgi:hypothetical protein